MAKLRKRESTNTSPESSAPQSTGDTTAGVPERERIAIRAYERYLARGAADGAAMDDWLAAERELVADHDPKRDSE